MKSGLPDVQSLHEWLPKQIRVGIDPYLIDSDSFNSMSNALRLSGSVLVEVTPNLIDTVWTDKPNQDFPQIHALNFQFSGKRASDKIGDLRKIVKDKGASSIVISALDEVACKYITFK